MGRDDERQDQQQVQCYGGVCLETFAPVSYPLAFSDVILGSSAIRVSRELATPDLEEVVFTLGRGYPTSWSLYPYTG